MLSGAHTATKILQLTHPDSPGQTLKDREKEKTLTEGEKNGPVRMAGSFTPAVLLTDLRVESVDLVVDLVVVEGEGEAATGRWHDIVHDTGRVLVDIVNARLWPPTDFHGCHALFRTESVTR